MVAAWDREVAERRLEGERGAWQVEVGPRARTTDECRLSNTQTLSPPYRWNRDDSEPKHSSSSISHVAGRVYRPHLHLYCIRRLRRRSIGAEVARFITFPRRLGRIPMSIVASRLSLE